MKSKKQLLFFLLLTSIAGFSATINITASNSIFSFSQPNVTISFGDIVHFTLGSLHDAVEVSQTTWNNNSTGPVTGFQVGFGGNADVTGLSVGTHWYVCQAHVQ